MANMDILSLVLMSQRRGCWFCTIEYKASSESIVNISLKEETYYPHVAESVYYEEVLNLYKNYLNDC